MDNIIDKRTKGEWFIQKDLSEDEFCPYIKIMSNIAGRTLIADVNNFRYMLATTEEAEANAAFICKAVNNYDSLLEALKKMLPLFSETVNEWVLTQEPDGNFLQSEFEEKNKCYEAIINAKAAIQKAEQ